MNAHLITDRARAQRGSTGPLMMLALQPLHLVSLAIILPAALLVGGVLLAALLLASDLVLWRLFAGTRLGTRWLAARAAELASQRRIRSMDVAFRRELDELEGLAMQARRLATTLELDAQLDGLLTTYIELAVSCSERRRLLTLAVVPPAQLSCATQPRSDRIDALRKSRAELVELREELVQRSRCSVEELEQQIALVADAIRLLHQQAIADSCSLDFGSFAQEVNQLAATVRQAADQRTRAESEVEVVVLAERGE